MAKAFPDYLALRRPLLDEAFQQTLAGLLDGVDLEDVFSLASAFAGGKKLRGCLACLISEALGGTVGEAIPRAVAVELIQTATLIHDDFVDQHWTRRDRPAVWTLEGARRAVLIGDVIFASAIRMMSELSARDGTAVSRAIAEVSQGALHEPLDPPRLARMIVAGKLDGELYEKIIYLKTGALFGTACRLGAIAAKADSELAEVAYRYGLHIGEAYQIADDLQEVEQHLARRSIRPDQMTALAPAFLHYVAETRPYVLGALEGELKDWDEAAAGFFRAAAKCMEEEIGRRLSLAIAAMADNFPDNSYQRLMCEAPGEIIRMFNGS